MKTLILAGLFLIPILSISQDSAISHTFIKSADSMTKNAIYEKVKLWIASNYENATPMNQMDDKETGLLAFATSAHTLSPNAPKVKDNSDREMVKLLPYYHDFTFNIKIQIKDGRYKIDFDNIIYVNISSEYRLTTAIKAPYKYGLSKQSKADAEWADAKISFSHYAANLVESLHSSVIKKDDW
jgi:hypothetical protein